MNRRWWLALATLCLAGLVVRVSYVLIARRGLPVQGDAYQYHYGANLLVDGRGFIDALKYNLSGQVYQTAQHPPLYTVALALSSLLGLRSILDHQLWSCVIGTGSIALVGVVGRRLGGPRTGLIAAALTAVYPNAWILDALLGAETLSLLTAALFLLAAYRLWERPSKRSGVELGLACGLAALTRSEALVLLPLALLALALATRRTVPRRRLVAVSSVALAAFVAVVAPWLAINQSRFHHPPLGTSAGFDLALVQGNCDEAWYGATTGYYSQRCIPDEPAGDDESDADRAYRKAAIDYVRDNAARLPFVVFAREGRAWDFYQPLEQVHELEPVVQDRDPGIATLGLGMYYGLAGGAAAGVVVLRRRGVAVFPLIALMATVALAVALTWGETRYRASAEPALVLLAAVAADEAWRRRQSRAGGHDRRPTAGEQRSPVRGSR